MSREDKMNEIYIEIACANNRGTFERSIVFNISTEIRTEIGRDLLNAARYVFNTNTIRAYRKESITRDTTAYSRILVQ